MRWFYKCGSPKLAIASFVTFRVFGYQPRIVAVHPLFANFILKGVGDLGFQSQLPIAIIGAQYAGLS
ncbi:hypothetical protein [Nostoc sp. UCD121]|uniref:hypothetical protein n=1 Tax=Nostoc sp. UCD121 TaxID=2681305 RepID=UPI001628BBF1|nr:hypothetical protein [Nostoc sp. UCD121]